MKFKIYTDLYITVIALENRTQACCGPCRAEGWKRNRLNKNRVWLWLCYKDCPGVSWRRGNEKGGLQSKQSIWREYGLCSLLDSGHERERKQRERDKGGMKNFLQPLIMSPAPAGYRQRGHPRISRSFLTTQDPLWAAGITALTWALKFKSHMSNNHKHRCLLVCHREVGQVQACIETSRARSSSKEMHSA